jgi:hypothetical protein
VSGGPTNNRAFSPSEKSGAVETAYHLSTVQRMLPLVGRIVADLLQAHRRLAQLQGEREHLDRRRRTLAWPERQRRYCLGEELADQETHLEEVRAELEVLGVVLFTSMEGWVGFPTVVNQRRAYFVWHPGHEEVRHWQFLGEGTFRPIPAAWFEDVKAGSPR